MLLGISIAAHFVLADTVIFNNAIVNWVGSGIWEGRVWQASFHFVAKRRVWWRHVGYLGREVESG